MPPSISPKKEVGQETEIEIEAEKPEQVLIVENKSPEKVVKNVEKVETPQKVPPVQINEENSSPKKSESQKGSPNKANQGLVEVMRVIKRRNVVRQWAVKIKQSAISVQKIIPNKLVIFFATKRFAKQWVRKGSSRQTPGKAAAPGGSSPGANITLTNALTMKRAATSWKASGIRKKFALIYPRTIAQLSTFKKLTKSWKSAGLKRIFAKIFTPFSKLIQAKSFMKKWKNRKPGKPGISIQALIALRMFAGRWKKDKKQKQDDEMNFILPKSLSSIIIFRAYMRRWKKDVQTKLKKIIDTTGSLLRIFTIKKKAKNWKELAMSRRDLREGLDDKKGKISRKASEMEKKGQDKVKVVEKKESIQNVKNLGRTESSMSNASKIDVDVDLSEKIEEKEEIKEEVNEADDNMKSMAAAARVAGFAFHHEEKSEEAEEKKKIVIKKDPKQIRLEKLANLKKTNGELQGLLETSKNSQEKAEVELDKIKPFYRAAQEDSKLSAKLVLWIKSIRFNPPEVIRILMEAICVLKGIKPYVKYDKTTKKILFVDYWVPSKKLLGGDFLQELQSLRRFGAHRLEYLKEFVGYVLPNPDFDRSKIEYAYPPCALLYDWIMAVYDLGNVSLKYEKKWKKVQEAESSCDQILCKMRRISHEICKIEREIIKEEKYNSKEHFTTKLTLLPGSKSYTFTVTGSSKRKYEYDFIQK